MKNDNTIVKDSKKILVIGNGFDIDVGLRTKYSDFAHSPYWPFSRHVGLYTLPYFLNARSNIDRWFDLEVALETFATSPKFIPSTLENEKLLVVNYSMLCESFMDYLKNEEDCSCLNKDSLAAKVLRSVIKNGFYESIYTFNYTDLVSIANKLDITLNRNVIHIHGAVADRSIIVGFNEDVDVDHKLMFMYKTFNKNYMSNSLRHDLLDAQEIVIFGHSLGRIDYSYFRDLFISLVTDSRDKANKRKVTIFTFNDESRLDIMKQLRNMNHKQTELLYGLNDFNIICTDGTNERKINEFLDYQEKYSCNNLCHSNYGLKTNIIF